MVGGIHGKKVIAGIVVAILIGVGTWLSNQGNTITQTTTGGTVLLINRVKVIPLRSELPQKSLQMN